MAGVEGSAPFAVKTTIASSTYADDQPDDFQRKSITSYSEEVSLPGSVIRRRSHALPLRPLLRAAE